MSSTAILPASDAKQILLANLLVSKDWKEKAHFFLSGKVSRKFEALPESSMKYFVITILAGLLLSPILVSASDFDLETLLENLENNTSVQTNVNVKVNTGGNVATSNQKIITGSYQVDVRIENQVDGEKQQPIEIHLDSNDNPTSYSETRKSANSTTSIEVKVADDGVDVTASNQVNTDELAEDSPDQVSAESGVADDNQPSVVDTIITFIKNAFKGIFSKIFN